MGANEALGALPAFFLGMMLQLNPSIPVDTPKGSGQAAFLIDYSPEHDLYWVVFLDDSRQCWTFSNREILVQENYTLGRRKHKDAFIKPIPAPNISN